MSPADCEDLPNKCNLLVNVFTYAKQIGADAFAWCCGVGPTLSDHERIENVHVSYCHGYPTDRMRNAACKQAKRDGFSFLLMIDDDTKPDLGGYPEAVPFLKSAIDFMLAHDGPCVVGAPYCGSPPLQEVMVMKNREYAPDLLDGCGLKLDKYTRDEASVLTGIQRVAALPTGCMLIDLRVLDILPPPWFSYEYDDAPFNTKLASTEDIVFSRNCDWLGIPQYCHWSAWAGHQKTYLTGKPLPAPVADIPGSIYKAWSNGWRPKAKPELV